jgi:hypothetical protein
MPAGPRTSTCSAEPVQGSQVRPGGGAAAEAQTCAERCCRWSRLRGAAAGLRHLYCAGRAAGQRAGFMWIVLIADARAAPPEAAALMIVRIAVVLRGGSNVTLGFSLLARRGGEGWWCSTSFHESAPP